MNWLPILHAVCAGICFGFAMAVKMAKGEWHAYFLIGLLLLIAAVIAAL